MFDFDVLVEEAELQNEELTTKWSEFQAKVEFIYDTSGNKKIFTFYTCKAVSGFASDKQVMNLSQLEYAVERADLKIDSIWLAPEHFIETNKGRRKKDGPNSANFVNNLLNIANPFFTNELCQFINFNFLLVKRVMLILKSGHYLNFTNIQKSEKAQGNIHFESMTINKLESLDHSALNDMQGKPI